MREHCAFLPDGSWNWDIGKRQTKRAICGIGALHPGSGHRIMRFLQTYLSQFGLKDPNDLERMIQEDALPKLIVPDSEIDTSAPYLSRVAKGLIGALTFAWQKKLGYFGDVANRLYPCLPLPGDLLPGKLPSRDDYLALQQKLDVLNDRAIVAKWSHLRDASAWITAGSAVKLPAIWTLVITRFVEQRRGPGQSEYDSVMNQLTTDSVTAQHLLEALEKFEMAPTRVQQWYADLAEVLFQPCTQSRDVGSQPR
jgi:hypothetical protein